MPYAAAPPPPPSAPQAHQYTPNSFAAALQGPPSFVTQQMPGTIPTMVNGNTPAWWGRTAQELAEEEGRQRESTAAAARDATNRAKPAAQPSDMFYVVSADGTSRTLMSFATIEDLEDGRWMRDPADGISFYMRGHQA